MVMNRKQAELYAYLLFGLWLGLKLLTFIITPLLALLRWPLHIIFIAAAAMYAHYLYLDAQKKKQKTKASV